MNRARLFQAAAIVGLVAIVVTIGVYWRNWRRLSDGVLLFDTSKVCQLTGTYDKQWHVDTPNHTSQFGVTGSDYGYPVPFKNKLYFLFGDTRSLDADDFDAERARKELGKGYDTVATAPLSTDIEQHGCFDMKFIENHGSFQPIQLQEKGKAVRTLGVFETPTTGFSDGATLYAFFSLRNLSPGCTKKPDGCALGDEDEQAPTGGQTKLATLTDESSLTFTELSRVSESKFQWPVAIVERARDIPNLPEQVGSSHFIDRVVLIWGSGREDYYFRRGYPFLAIAPLSSVGAMSSWRYFAGLANGKPIFKEGEENAQPLPPFGAERDPGYGQPPYHRCVGEFSVAYVPEWAKWLMLYSCGSTRNEGYNKDNGRGIYLRSATVPWGPWSPPRKILDPGDAYCYFMYHKDTQKCQNKPNPYDKERVTRDGKQNPLLEKDGSLNLMYGGEYAPFLIPTYTKVDAESTYLYFVLSTWNPYQSVLMRTRVRPLRSLIVQDVASRIERVWQLIRP